MSIDPQAPYPSQDPSSYNPYASSGQPSAYGAQPGYQYPEPLAYQAPGGAYPGSYPQQPGFHSAVSQGWDPTMMQVQQMAMMSNQTRSNALGAWSLGLSIVGLLCCTYFVAQVISIGLGIAGLVAHRNNHANNGGMAIAGIVISVISIALWTGLYALGLYADSNGL